MGGKSEGTAGMGGGSVSFGHGSVTDVTWSWASTRMRTCPRFIYMIYILLKKIYGIYVGPIVKGKEAHVFV